MKQIINRTYRTMYQSNKFVSTREQALVIGITFAFILAPVAGILIGYYA